MDTCIVMLVVWIWECWLLSINLAQTKRSQQPLDGTAGQKLGTGQRAASQNHLHGCRLLVLFGYLVHSFQNRLNDS